jgi:hypothetical protein
MQPDALREHAWRGESGELVPTESGVGANKGRQITHSLESQSPDYVARSVGIDRRRRNHSWRPRKQKCPPVIQHRQALI